MLDKIPTIPSRPQTAADSFSLQRRRATGDTPRLGYWGFDDETDPLTDVLLAGPDHLRHLATSSLSRKFLRESPADLDVARAQHRELTAAYRPFGVRLHTPPLEAELPMQVYTPDSSVMTAFGGTITPLSHGRR